MMILMKWISCVLIWVSFMGCQKSTPPSSSSQTSTSEQKKENLDQTLEEPSGEKKSDGSKELDDFQNQMEAHTNTSFSLQDVAWHPEGAKIHVIQQPSAVSVSDTVDVEENLSFDGVALPEFEVKRENSSFLTVLRCTEKVKLEDAKGDWSDRLMQWNAAFGDPSCRLIGTHILNLKILDQSADKGRYFYVLNPCVAEESSSINKEDCSYRYVKTEIVEVEKGWSQKRREIERDVMAIEAEVSALMHRWYTNIRRGMKSQQKCEYVYLDRQLANAHMRSVMYGLGAVVSAGFGGVTAVQSKSKSTGVFTATLIFAVIETLMRLVDPGRLDPTWWDPSNGKCPEAETWTLENSQIQADLVSKQRKLGAFIEKERALDEIFGQLDRQILEEYLGEIFRTEGAVFDGADPIKSAVGATAKL